jgi:hypothetical protein
MLKLSFSGALGAAVKIVFVFNSSSITVALVTLPLEL